MSFNFLEKVSFADVVAVAVILKMLYTGYYLGIIPQIFPFIVYFVTFIVALMFYQYIGLIIAEATQYPESITRLMAFLAIFILFFLIRKVCEHFLPLKRDPKISVYQRILGPVFALIQSVIMISILYTLIVLTPITEVSSSSKSSYVAQKIFMGGLTIYTGIIRVFGMKGEDGRPMSVEEVYTGLFQPKDFEICLDKLRPKARGAYDPELLIR